MRAVTIPGRKIGAVRTGRRSIVMTYPTPHRGQLLLCCRADSRIPYDDGHKAVPMFLVSVAGVRRMTAGDADADEAYDPSAYVWDLGPDARPVPPNTPEVLGKLLLYHVDLPELDAPRPAPPPAAPARPAGLPDAGQMRRPGRGRRPPAAEPQGGGLFGG